VIKTKKRINWFIKATQHINKSIAPVAKLKETYICRFVDQWFDLVGCQSHCHCVWQRLFSSHNSGYRVTFAWEDWKLLLAGSLCWLLITTRA